MKRIKVACIGDSITHGSTLFFRKRFSYPSVLNRLASPIYIVKNFGVSGACATTKSDQAYSKEKSYSNSLKYLPNIVFIMLGTNDSKTQNWNATNFKKDYINIINTYQNLSSNPKIYLMTPIPGFEDKWDIQCDVIENQILPIIIDLANELRIEIIDVFTPFKHKSNFTTDNIHPNIKGAFLLAEIVNRELS